VDEGLSDETTDAPNRFRLPTMAEWEYACRAGTTTRTYYGTREDLMSCYAWAGFMDKLQVVGTLMPNDFGLFDMYGNVAEWTGDVVNGGEEVRTAGGAYRIPYARLHSGAFLDVKAELKYNSFGIRVARTIELDADGRPK
jgi:formylglycine-generating enzyme required for sulfatase activity